ncbi:MAG: ribonuclease D [Hyphomicrobium sp.]|nr:ribonuclease D [Hyphomicrobium sp.]
MHLVTSTSDLAKVCESLVSAEFIAVDTEFMREQTFWPELCLVQIASDSVEAIIDPLATGIDLKPFYELMAHTGVTKVFHAARQDIEIMYSEAGLIPAPIFDTQVAASVCGYGDSVSYVNLVKDITGHDIDKSSRFTDWSRRPLTDKQLVYALGDVTHLRDVYRHLRSKLDATGRTSWLSEEMADLTHPETYETRPEDAWKRLKMRTKNRKSFGVLIELAAWRERAAQAQNVPRSRVLRDEALYDIANQMPTTPEQLGGLRTLSDGFSRSQRAREIIEAVKAGIERDPKTLPQMNHSRAVSAEAGATIELLKVLLKAAAAKHGVAPRLLADAEELERIAAEDEPDVLALKGWRRQLFGEDAVRLKRGELALTLAGGEVRVLPGAGSG